MNLDELDQLAKKAKFFVEGFPHVNVAEDAQFRKLLYDSYPQLAARLRAADVLVEYARHTPSCIWQRTVGDDCDCGFKDAWIAWGTP